MRRRAQADAVSDVPAELVRFDPADWPDPGPPPSTWPAAEEYPWPLFARRVAWLRARRAWVADQPDVALARASFSR